MLDNINISDNSYNNLEIIDKLYTNNIKLNKTLFNINIVLHTNNDNNYYINLNQSNYIFLIENINKPNYNKDIIEVQKNDNSIFYSNNHNLKINDIIYLNNINSLLNTNLQNKFLLYKVTHSTSNSFQIISYDYFDNNINNINNIIHSSTLLNNCFFNLISTNKTFKRIISVEQYNKIISPNHQLQLNNIIKLINIKNNNQENILYEQYIDISNLFIVTSIIDINTFEITSYINNQININQNIFNANSIIEYGFFNIYESNNLNKNINFILPSNTTNSLGYTYNFIITDPTLNSFSIKTSNSDKLIGFSKFSSQYITGSDFIYTSNDNSTTFSISNLDISQSKFEIINIKKNIWLLNSYIYNNKITYYISYNKLDNSILFNNTKNYNIILYKNFIYELDISHNSLQHNNINIIDNKNNNFFKNIINFGITGKSDSKIVFYIDNNFINNQEYKLKYIDTSKFSKYELKEILNNNIIETKIPHKLKINDEVFFNNDILASTILKNNNKYYIKQIISPTKFTLKISKTNSNIYILIPGVNIDINSQNITPTCVIKVNINIHYTPFGIINTHPNPFS